MLACVIYLCCAPVSAKTECVVLLHGLARTSSSMADIENALSADGYIVANIGYKSRSASIEELAPLAVQQGLEHCEGEGDGEDITAIHFVTHSLGGILVRYYLSGNEIEKLGRVVMLAPPNQGSKVVDNWRAIPGYGLLNGPAGDQLGIGPESIPLSLGAVEFELGVIAGDRSNNPILSMSLDNPDDGKVSLENTKVEGMKDFIRVSSTHTFIMSSKVVIEQIRHFIAFGKFVHESD
jgi:triacylglycerol lipase